jgi:hypothetical protein
MDWAAEWKVLIRPLPILAPDAVKNIAVCSAVYQAFNSRKGDSAFNLKLFWWHSLKCALLSRIFAKEVAYGSPDEAFVAGLLHDIGKLVLWVNFSEKYTELIKKYENRPKCSQRVKANWVQPTVKLGPGCWIDGNSNRLLRIQRFTTTNPWRGSHTPFRWYRLCTQPKLSGQDSR